MENETKSEARDAAPLGAGRRARAALVSASAGLLRGILVLSVLGTLKVMLSPGLEVESPAGWVFGPINVFAEGLFWSLLGGAMFVLPPAFLIFVFLARRARPDASGAHATLAGALGVWAALFAPLYVFGLRGHVVDGLLLGVSVWVGVRRGLRQLTRRLAPR